MATTAHKYVIRNAAAGYEWSEIETYYTIEEMEAALCSSDLDCGFVGEFLDKLMGRSVYCDSSDFISLKHDVLSFEADYEDINGYPRTIEIRVMEVF